MVGFAACMAVIGLIPTVPIFIVSFMRIEGREPWRIVIPMAAAVVLLIYVVFDQLLAIPWPPTLPGPSFLSEHHSERLIGRKAVASLQPVADLFVAGFGAPVVEFRLPARRGADRYRPLRRQA